MNISRMNTNCSWNSMASTMMNDMHFVIKYVTLSGLGLYGLFNVSGGVLSPVIFSPF